MNELLRLREQYGPNTYALVLPDGRYIPYKLLSIGEYLEYQQLFEAGQYPPSYIEDEIFKKCVLDKVLVDHIGLLKAGSISTTVGVILLSSGPGTIEQLNTDLNLTRMKASSGLHEMVGLICQAFSSYKPEEVYQLDYETFVLRLAQAEKKLLALGILSEPLQILAPEPARPSTPRDKLAQMKRDWEQEHQPVKFTPHPPVPPPTEEQTIITSREMQSHSTALGPDPGTMKMARETAGIYDNYLEQMKRGEKVKILTPEERQEAYTKYAQAAKVRVQKRAAEERAQFKKELAEALQEKAKGRKKRRRR